MIHFIIPKRGDRIFNRLTWVGIGTSSPVNNLDVASSATSVNAVVRSTSTGSTNVAFRVQDGTTGTGSGDGLYLGRAGTSNYLWTYENEPWVFGTNGTTRMTIDSSGNVLVGKTSSDSTTAGVDLRPEGVGVFVRDANRPLIANRLTDDGELIQFRKDGTAVGSIDNDGADRLIVNSENTTGYLAVDGAVKFRWRTNDFIPHDDNAKDLGVSGARFKDLYLSGGVYLGGTGSANKLDDYEEGTFVPTVTATQRQNATMREARDRGIHPLATQ